MDTQLAWFANNIEEMERIVGAERTREFLGSSLFAVIMGSNDYINNYLLSNSKTGRTYTIPQFRDLLVDTFLGQLQVSPNSSSGEGSIFIGIDSQIMSSRMRDEKNEMLHGC
jgi:hypothetical protein